MNIKVIFNMMKGESMTTNVKGSLRGITVYEIGKTIQRSVDGRVNKNSPSIVEGIKPAKKTLDEGSYTLEPKHILTLLVPTQKVENGKIHGFQREAKKPHIRKIATAMGAGKKMPVIEVGLYKNGAWLVDGQQRALAAIIANVPVDVFARKLTAEEMHDLFADQQKQLKINPSTLVLSASDDFSEYVQDAVTDNSHPWNSLVTYALYSESKMTPKQMFDSVSGYVTNTIGAHIARNIEDYTFDKDRADELAKLFSAFGNKKTNPLAYRPVGIKAITYAATIIVRRNESKKQDIERWGTWMPKFPFEQYLSIRKSKELASMMIRHWNKRLSKENRIKVPDDLD
jgi:hypothetical protein